MKVALILAGNPYAPNGAAGYMRRMYETRECVKRYGVEAVYLCHGGINFTDSERYVMSLGARAKKTIKRALRETRWGSRLESKLVANRRGLHALAMYDELGIVPDVVVFNDTITHDLFLKRHSGYSGMKVQILHNNGEFGKMIALSSPKVDPAWIKELEERIVNDSDVLVFVGAKNKQRFDVAHPECAGKSVHIHLGIEDIAKANTFHAKASDFFTFVCVGTVGTRKNQRVLMDVAEDPSIAQRARFIVVGDGPDYESCKKEADARGLSSLVQYVGASSNVAEYSRTADGFISVSLDEGLPTVAIEAMSFGLPLVLTDVGGCAEVINGNGVLIETCEASAIVKSIKQFFELFDAGEISGIASRELFEQHYTTENMWEEYVETFNEFMRVQKGR